MADKKELLYLPKSDSTSLVLSEAGVSLIARGRREATSLLLRKKESLCLADVKLHGKWGFIGRDGKFAVEPSYGFVYRFRSGRAAFSYSSGSEGSLWGYLGSDGKVISSPQFDWAGEFYEGLAKVKFRGKFGFIQKDGTFAIKPQFDSASWRFKDGTAAVSIGDVWRLIDRNGSFVGKAFDNLRESGGDASAAKVGSMWGFVNRRGEFLIEPKFDFLLDVDGGGWSARTNGRSTLIDYDGNVVISVANAVIISHDEGMTCIGTGERGRYRSFVDKEGKTIFQWDHHKEVAGWFRDGVCLLTYFRDGRLLQVWGEEDYKSADAAYYLDKKGRRLNVEPIMAVNPFSGGRGIVTDGERFGYIDRAGRSVTPIEFLEAGPFIDGYAQVLTESKVWKWIDQSGAGLAEPQFPDEGTAPLWIRPFEDPQIGRVPVPPSVDVRFHEGLCRVRSKELWGFVGTRCQIAVRPTFANARNFSCGLAAVEDDRGKWGYINKAGDMVIPCQFESAGDFEIVDLE